MKRYLVAMMLLFLLIPVSAQVELGVSDGDSFEFKLVSWSEGSNETAITVEDDFDSDTITFKEGDTFTVTVVNATIAKDDGDSFITTEYAANGKSIKVMEYIDWGGFIVIPDWNTYRDEFNSELSGSDNGITDSDGDYSKITLIDTDTEFGLKEETKYGYSDTDYSYSGSSTYEVRYEKSTGVITKSKSSYSYADVSSGVTEDESFSAEVIRVGFDSDSGVSLPGFQLYLLIPAALAVVIIRKHK